ncbi:hypothetical protein [Actinacidiphila epipremni]|uniref:Uncharacterized protein n=1 Tax=Actinacidiphila epipremni TaxID=2053013 RepID=A0ABX0ZKW0_9ACTN|nr:hypothetical protein [Actinacidiphila epipremni]NJP42301.1 hypothetical protein [Actinacidiphila epipremni]
MSTFSAAMVAARDQAQALVRDLSATEPVLFADFPSGEGCTWCDCPVTAPDTVPCGGCTRPATTVLRLYRAGEQADVWPVCDSHLGDARRVIAIYVASTAPG